MFKMWNKYFVENLEEYTTLLEKGTKKEDIAQWKEWERVKKVHDSIWNMND